MCRSVGLAHHRTGAPSDWRTSAMPYFLVPDQRGLTSVARPDVERLSWLGLKSTFGRVFWELPPAIYTISNFDQPKNNTVNILIISCLNPSFGLNIYYWTWVNFSTWQCLKDLPMCRLETVLRLAGTADFASDSLMSSSMG